MKTLVTAYTFNASAQTVTFTGYTSINLNQVLLITDTTTNTLIYLFSNPALGGTVSGNVLTLTYNTTALSNSDALQIYYDDPNASINVTLDGNDCNPVFSGTVSTTGPGTSYDSTGNVSTSVQVSGSSWSGIFNFEGSNDNTNWTPLLALDINELTMIDEITTNGIYAFKNTARYIRYNVKTVTGTITMTVIGRSSVGADSSDRVSLALDQNSGVALSTNILNLRVDAIDSLILSDAPISSYGTANIVNKPLLTLDTSGYQSVALQIFGTWAGTVTFQESNDGSNWYNISGWSSALPNQSTSSAAGNGLFTIPAIGKYFRVVETAFTSGVVQAIAFLRNQPAVPPLAVPSVAISGNAGSNIAAVNGTSPPTANVGGVLPIGGNTAPGTALTVYPLSIGGSDASGLARRIQTDTTGRLATVGGIPAPTGIQNVAPLGVSILDQFEGQSVIELLAQILIELKIHSHQNAELPTQLQTGQGIPGDDPAIYRNDPSFYTI